MGKLEAAGNGREWIVDNINWYGVEQEAREDAPGRPGAQNFRLSGE